MLLRPLLLSLLFQCAFAFFEPSHALVKEGLTFEDKVSVETEELKLQCLGVRKKFFVKVYVAGLYLPEKQRDAGKILTSERTRFLKIQFLRDVERKKVVDAWREGYQKNCIFCKPRKCETCGETDKAFERLMASMPDVKKWDIMTFAFFQDRVTGNVGNKIIELRSKGIDQNILSIFLGPEPADTSLKSQLLNCP